MRVVPTGWNWAVFAAQQARSRILRVEPSGPQRWLLGRQPPPRVEQGQPAVVLYVDNFAALGTDAAA
eukprot:15186768-Alexandrium_andersonii.AAC.1